MGKEVWARGWMITLKADDYDKETVEAGLAAYPFMGQLEKSDSGYLHWQIWVEAKSPVRFSTLKNTFPTGHFEKRMGTKMDCFAYVSKAETFAGVSVANNELGAPDPGSDQGRRSDLVRFTSLLDDGMTVNELVLAEPSAIRYVSHLRQYKNALDLRDGARWRDLTVKYLHGETGVGKTRYVFEKYGSDAYRVSNYANPFDNYAGEKVLILDEFYGDIEFNYLLNILDGYPLHLRARYEDRIACFTEVWVISNVPLEHHYLQIQRDNPRGWDALLRRFDTVEAWDDFKVSTLAPVPV